jgi:hypothetical protein
VNVALVDPAGIETLAGTVAALVLLLESVTTAPPDGAAAVSVAVPVAFTLPPVTFVGEIESDDSVTAGGGVDGVCTVKLRVEDHEPAVPALFRPRTRHQYWRAVRADVVSCDTVVVVLIVNGDANELDVSTWIWYDAALITSFQSNVKGCETVAPLDGASNVGAAGVPPDGGGGGDPPPCTVNTAPQLVLRSAQTLACVVDVTLVVETLNVALVAPAGTVTLAGTAAGLIDDSCTIAPPNGAAALSLTVAVDDEPPGTLVGLSASDVTHRFSVAAGLTVTLALTFDAP